MRPPSVSSLGARLRGRTATQRSKKDSEKVFGKGAGESFSRVLRACYGLTVKRVLRRVLIRGSEKGVSGRCLERPLGEYDPLGVHPTSAPLDCNPTL